MDAKTGWAFAYAVLAVVLPIAYWALVPFKVALLMAHHPVLGPEACATATARPPDRLRTACRNVSRGTLPYSAALRAHFDHFQQLHWSFAHFAKSSSKSLHHNSDPDQTQRPPLSVSPSRAVPSQPLMAAAARSCDVGWQTLEKAHAAVEFG